MKKEKITSPNILKFLQFIQTTLHRLKYKVNLDFLVIIKLHINERQCKKAKVPEQEKLQILLGLKIQ
jgi:hypothetical protein